MNRYFNIIRFNRLFIKHTVEHYKSYLMSLTVLLGVMLLGGTFIVYMIPGTLDTGFQSAIFMIILLLAGTVFTSTIFADYGDKKKSMSTLTLPASHFEKYLVAWIYSFVIFVLVFTSSFYLILSFLIHIKSVPGQKPEIFNLFDSRISSMYLLFALLQSIALYGAIAFEKLHFIKTAFAFFITITLLFLFNYMVLSGMIGTAIHPSPPFGNLRIIENTRELTIGVPEQQNVLVPYTLVILVFMFWIAAYFRLKEKQV